MPDTIVNKKEWPLVSCIMPTYNRRRFVPNAIEYFLRQEYSNKELIIIDDGNDIVEDLVPDHPAIRYYRLNEKITLGAKLNLGCSYANGGIIANWDDDDWYATRRLQYQVDALENNKAELCGINNLLYYDLENNLGYRYVYPADQRLWLLGSSLCYTKKLWCKNHFADIDVGMDGLFVWATSPDCVKVLDDISIAVHMIHENNVSPKKTSGAWWHAYPVENLEKIMTNDWHLYKNGNARGHEKIFLKTDVLEPTLKNATEVLKNIHACLVHESKECIIDLVRNLHYHDPASIILLYNGGNDHSLFEIDFPFERFGAVIHPDPSPVKHGYLHNFALDSMDFALKNFSFDCITMVDSDQLAVRQNYSAYLKQSLTLSPHVGMLSSKPRRLTINDNADIDVWPAMQALKEFYLWKPLLQKFKNGEDKFVHWTFWPSSVFSADASRDLVKLFKENKLLHEIMNQTNIWATEEVILPTLVAVLGYEIGLNPCSYDFVKYQRSFTLHDVIAALNNPDSFWVHPVKREYNDSLRDHIRQQHNHYIQKMETINNTTTGEILMTLSILDTIKDIQGWLSDNEADLLIATTIKACMHQPQEHAVVEIGCYHGKSSVLFGMVLQKLFPQCRLYSIDPHEGELGAEDQGLYHSSPSFDMFKKNIEEAGVGAFVEIIKDYSYNVQWGQPIQLLFIDGLHDYFNVSRDFWHFSKWINKGGYVAFHDYAEYYRGVQIFVDELLQTGTYRKVEQANSLIVLQRL
jgi:glycosyltransferase involved in cell wall biosynthesis